MDIVERLFALLILEVAHLGIAAIAGQQDDVLLANTPFSSVCGRAAGLGKPAVVSCSGDAGERIVEGFVEDLVVHPFDVRIGPAEDIATLRRDDDVEVRDLPDRLDHGIKGIRPFELCIGREGQGTRIDIAIRKTSTDG